MKETLRHLDFVMAESNLAIHHYNSANVHRISFFYLGLLERIYAGTKSLKLLIENLDQDPTHEFAAGLVARTLILDFMIGARGYQVLKSVQEAGKEPHEEKSEVTEYCNIILGAGVTHTLKDLKAFQTGGGISEAQLHEAFANMAGKYEAFLQPYNNDGVAPAGRFPKAPQVKKIFECLAAGNDEMKGLSKYYNTYSFYSKYEHFGLLSYDLMRRLEQQQQSTLKQSLDLMVLHTFICLQVMLEIAPDNFLEEKAELVGEYLKYEVLKVPVEKEKAADK